MPAPPVLLYDYPGSICCQMVRLTLAEKDVAYEKQTVDIMQKAEQFEPFTRR
jgi:glutathione S-transferase